MFKFIEETETTIGAEDGTPIKVWRITAKPDTIDAEFSELLELFFAAEEDSPMGNKIVLREGVTITKTKQEEK